MSDDLPPVRCDDPSTWRHKGEKVDLRRLLQLIDENGGPEGLDLHGARLAELDARPEAVRPCVEAYGRALGAGAKPPGVGFGDTIGLYSAHLEEAVLVRAHLEHAGLIDAHLERAKLTQAHLRGAALSFGHLQDADLLFASLQDTDLCDAELQNATLTGAHLENATLWGATLENAALRHAHLENADFGGARLDGAAWYGCYLDRTRMRRDSFGQAIGDELKAHEAKTATTYRDASEAYVLLKNNFNSIGRHEDAAWAYIKEQQMEKMAYHWEWRPHGLRIWRAWGSFWRWVRNWAYELVSGYGEWLHMPLIWALAVVAVFTGIYAAAGNVASGDGGATHDFMTALTHSIAAFATVGFNTLEPVGWGARLLTAIEAMFGIGLFALFVFTLGNRMRRS